MLELKTSVNYSANLFANWNMNSTNDTKLKNKQSGIICLLTQVYKITNYVPRWTNTVIYWRHYMVSTQSDVIFAAAGDATCLRQQNWQQAIAKNVRKMFDVM